MKTLLIINIFIAFLFASNSQNVGNSFRYGSNAREIALGNSISSNYNIGFNSFNNPSLLSDLKNNEYGFSFFPMSLDRYIQTFSMSFPIPPSAGIGISFFKSGVKDIPETNTSGTPIGNYDSWEGYGMLSFGAKFNKNMLTGINIKVLRNQIKNYIATGVGVDLGFTYLMNEKNNISFIFNNISTKYLWENKGSSNIQYEEKFPLFISIGGTYINSANNFSLFYDVDYDFDISKYYPSLGVEYLLQKIPLSLRLGLKEQNKKIDYSFGFGYKFKIFNNTKLNIDYALDMDMHNEGSSHLFTFVFYR